MGIYLWITSSYLLIIIMFSILESNLNLTLYVEHNYGHFMASGGRALGIFIVHHNALVRQRERLYYSTLFGK